MLVGGAALTLGACLPEAAIAPRALKKARRRRGSKAGCLAIHS